MEEVQIWVHDSSGSYKRIDEILNRLKAFMSDLRPTRAYGSDGIVLEWLGKSGDLFDDEWNTLTRHHDYQLVTSQ